MESSQANPGILSSTISSYLAKTRTALVDQIWRGAKWLAVIEAPIIAWRIWDVGWHVQIGIHITLLSSAVVISYLKLPYRIKAGLLVFGAFLAGVAGIFTLGMIGAGSFWLIFCVGLVSILTSQRISLIISIISSLMLIIAGIGFVHGFLHVSFDVNEHVASASAWINFLAIIMWVPLVVFYAIRGFQSQIFDLIAQLQQQGIQLNTQRDLLEKLATIDSLTGLPVSRILDDRLQMALNSAHRSGEKFAVMFIDLDDFKKVNDTFGHAAGDYVLQTVAKRLQEHIRADDTIVRIGGDEFIGILGKIDRPEIAAMIAAKMIIEISKPILFGNGVTATVGASIGIAIFPDHAADVISLKGIADGAMYEAKKSGKNQFRFAQ